MNGDVTYSAPETTSRGSANKPRKIAAVWLIICGYWVWSAVRGFSHGKIGILPVVFVAIPIVLALFWLLILVGTRKIVGGIEHVQVTEPGFVERVRQRYTVQSAQLEIYGFRQLFYFGEAIPISRMFLVLPALVHLQMRSKGVPMTIYQGTKILNANPVFGAGDQSAYAHSNGIGITFHTAFRDGTVLLTRDHKDDSPYPGKVIVHSLAATVGEVWAAHQRSIESFATGLNPVDRQSSFEFYSAMVRKEVPTDL
jgi:hypothetical protein